jgi:hypothetical protein
MSCDVADRFREPAFPNGFRPAHIAHLAAMANHRFLGAKPGRVAAQFPEIHTAVGYQT